jgi:NRE family putative nickel resistance protein-like MFS transporter
VLVHPTFRRLWSAQVISGFGEAIASVAMPLLVYDITGSAGLLSLIFILQFAPRVVLSPVTGLMADRLDRRRLMIAADLGRALIVAGLPFATNVWQIGVLAALTAVGNAVARPAELAAVPMAVPAAELVPALSLSQVSSGIMRIAGPAVGAGIVGVAGPEPAFWLQTLCFVGSASILWGIRLPRSEQPQSRAGVRILAVAREDMAEGLRTVWQIPVVRGITAVESLWSVLGAALVIATVVLTKETLDLGDRAGAYFGLLTATMSAGAVLGALMASRLEQAIGRPRLMAIGYVGPLLLLPIAVTPPLPIIFACWFLVGFADAWAVISMQSYLAEAVPDQLRGRVYATWGAVITLAALIGFALVGWLTSRIGAPATLALSGALVGLGGPLLLFLTGALADVRRSAEGRVLRTEV